ncbi:MAG: lipid-binding SYLF domain-containing protein [Planctomycetia bacterium]|nr:lipid-binding SYLF domain-containing protein [Planctomycetia bacterium]
MRPSRCFLSAAAAACLSLASASARAQSPQTQTVIDAIEVLQGFTTFREQSIPQALLADAQAIAIIPNVVKGGFVLAGRFGRGVVLIRNPDGTWRTPIFVTFTGGSIGWQIGLQSTDVVLVFKNRKGIEKLMARSEFTLGADASIAAGPVGRNAAAGTDWKLNAEIYSYSRSRGLFAGVALDGSLLKVDNRANAMFYGNQAVVPEPALQLMSLVARDTSGGELGATVDPNAVAMAPMADTVENVRPQLVDAWRRLDPLLDANWRKFLALPPQVFQQAAPNEAALDAALERYSRVTLDAKYQTLYDRPEFRAANDLLLRYRVALANRQAAAIGPLAGPEGGLGQLPAPPGVGSPPAPSASGPTFVPQQPAAREPTLAPPR